MKAGRGSTGRAALLFVAAAVALVGAGAAVARPDTLGAWRRWAAFREGDACRAVTRPFAVSRAAEAVPALFVVRQDGGAPALAVALSRATGLGRVRLRIDGRSIGLVAAGMLARPAHAGAAAAIVAAMRGADLLVVEGRDRRGRAFREVYRLAGAASAIDAAMIGCPPG